jgi:hypothetical protein
MAFDVQRCLYVLRRNIDAPSEGREINLDVAHPERATEHFLDRRSAYHHLAVGLHADICHLVIDTNVLVWVVQYRRLRDCFRQFTSTQDGTDGVVDST